MNISDDDFRFGLLLDADRSGKLMWLAKHHQEYGGPYELINRAIDTMFAAAMKE